MDDGEGVATSAEVFTSVAQASLTGRATDLKVWGIGLGLYPAHRTNHFRGSLKYFVLCCPGSTCLSAG